MRILCLAPPPFAARRSHLPGAGQAARRFRLPNHRCSVFVLFGKNEESSMRCIDREEMIVLAFGWLVALAVTLT